jgi:CRP/FNR family transcriptional regulator, cyclic AMP receptor protein
VPGQLTVRLLGAEPDIARYLTADERAAAEELSLPVREVGRGMLDVPSLLGEAHAFAGLVLQGMLVQRLLVADQTALRLLGPGDILSLSATGPSLLTESGFSAAAPTRLAMLGDQILLAARRWPRLVAGLHVRATEQAERLGTQLAVCQLPRVDQRLLALMWLLAESWGVVTPHGTRLPLALTHDALGGLIGARRPTVTLALRELTERGAIVRQSDGWLLLEGPPAPSHATETAGEPALYGDSSSAWDEGTDQPTWNPAAYAELEETVRRLREQHILDVERFKERRTRIRQARDQAVRSRRKITGDALRRRRAPSS